MFEGEVDTFYQASVEKNHQQKIRRTVARLIEFGRRPKSLLYVTPHELSTIDQDEQRLSQELGVFIRIRSRQWIASNINRSHQTIAAFNSFLRSYTAFLQHAGGTNLARQGSHVGDRTVCVFLSQEAERRSGKTQLLEAVTDSLILWALEGTDPDKKIMMSRDAILQKILTTLPFAKHFVKGTIDHRLEQLANKANTNGREVRWHQKEDLFCLPFETRELIEEENREDEFLRITVLDQFRALGAAVVSPDLADAAAKAALAAIELTFEKEGLELASFIADGSGDDVYSSISDQIDQALNSSNTKADNRLAVKEAAVRIVRHAFYSSTEEQRLLFGKLSRTYALLLTLKADPRIVEYFRGMSSEFVLYVGTDLIVGALSERYLPEADQMRVNMLKILREAGATLILSDPTLEEIHSHLRATDWEFQNHFKEIEPFVTLDLVRHCQKILLRAYFYARLDSEQRIEPPKGWKSFLGQICSYEHLHKVPTGRNQIRSYLLDRFGMIFESGDDIRKLVDAEELDELATRLRSIKADDHLAHNDALHVLAVYGKRADIDDVNRPNRFGYRTWWLTHEARVRQQTGEIVQRHGAGYIIRPEFILNFIALSPTAAEVHQTYKSVFPSLLGVRLSNRMREEVFHDVMNKLNEVKQVDESRMRVMVADYSNRLKADNFKQYEAQLAKSRLGHAVVRAKPVEG